MEMVVARKHRTHISYGDSPVPDGLRPKHLTKQQFANRLYRLMQSKGWSQSELARQATNAASGDTTVTRDNVSTYIRASSLPGPQKTEALAAAFGINPDELLPNYAEGAIDEDLHPTFEIKAVNSAPGVAWVRVNRMVTMETATKIANLLSEDTAPQNDNISKPKGRR